MTVNAATLTLRLLTTPSLWSVMVSPLMLMTVAPTAKSTLSLRTHGVQNGEQKDSLSYVLTSAMIMHSERVKSTCMSSILSLTDATGKM